MSCLKLNYVYFIHLTWMISFSTVQMLYLTVFFSSFEFLFSCFTSNNKYVTLNLQVNNLSILQGLDSLNSLLFEKKLIKILRIYVKGKMGDVCKVLTNYEITKTNAFQELLKGLVKYYSKDIGEEIFFIFNYFWTNFKKVKSA